MKRGFESKLLQVAGLRKTSFRDPGAGALQETNKAMASATFSMH